VPPAPCCPLGGARQRNFQKQNWFALCRAPLEVLGQEGVTAANGCDRRFSLLNAALALGKGFAERRLSAWQRLCRAPDKRCSSKKPLLSVSLSGALCRAQIGLYRASQALGKPAVCSSECKWCISTSSCVK